MFGRIFFNLLLVAFLSACSTTLSHQPRAIFSEEDARLIVTRAFNEQPDGSRPVAAEVTDDAIILDLEGLKRSGWTGGVTSVKMREFYYFDNLAPLNTSKKNERWQVFLSYKDKSVWRWVFFYDEQKALNFIDAIESLSQSKTRGLNKAR